MVLHRQRPGLLRRYELGRVPPGARYSQTRNDSARRGRHREEDFSPKRPGTQLRSRRRLSGRRHLGRDRQRIESRHSSKTFRRYGAGFVEHAQSGPQGINPSGAKQMNVQELFTEVVTAPVVKRAITNHAALNEAYDYGSAFSRGMRIDLNGLTILLISGTASIDEAGRTVHLGDFRAQLRRTYDNITQLLAAEC